MPCEAKHTKYQPTDPEWLCPKCGANNEHFWIEEGAEGADCDQLHDADELVCTSCGWAGSGHTFAGRLQKYKNLVPCPCCKGTGLIHKTEQA